MDYKHLTAPCGLDCFNCPMYLAGENEELRKKVSENMNIPFERTMCLGCRGEEGTISFLNMTEVSSIRFFLSNLGNCSGERAYIHFSKGIISLPH